MVYLKQAEEISDFIKLLGAINALFYYEDIRIYRDHKILIISASSDNVVSGYLSLYSITKLFFSSSKLNKSCSFK